MKRLFFYIALFTAAILAACSDDDSFTTNPSARLTFSRDTVSLDTIFSTVPTSTYTFWVYNNNGDGLR
ncbi:MAG: right-handed parallel beta-helix repeat-containing protein, partial [Prevotella sp.]|nr:right-handed parallel beta-helix repeat-containing protein [Prevotella sp.]